VSGLEAEAEAFFGEGCAAGVFERANAASADGQGVASEVLGRSSQASPHTLFLLKHYNVCISCISLFFN
jgi:hypothetical protein